MRTEFYPFLNEQLKELVQQIEMYIQLLYQVLLFTPPDSDKKPPSDKKKNEEPSISQELKKRAYWLLYDFMRQKESVLKHLNLPKYVQQSEISRHIYKPISIVFLKPLAGVRTLRYRTDERKL